MKSMHCTYVLQTLLLKHSIEQTSNGLVRVHTSAAPATFVAAEPVVTGSHCRSSMCDAGSLREAKKGEVRDGEGNGAFMYEVEEERVEE